MGKERRGRKPQGANVSKDVSEVTPEVMALAQKIQATQAKRVEAMKANIAAKYPQADVDSLRFDPTVNKYVCTINCKICGDGRDVFTSDLFQVDTCTKCSSLAKAAKKLGKKALLAKAIALIEAGEVK